MNHIDPKKTYAMYEIMKLGVLGKTRNTVRKKVMDDLLEDNILKTETEGKGTERRYRILGANLERYLRARESLHRQSD